MCFLFSFYHKNSLPLPLMKRTKNSLSAKLFQYFFNPLFFYTPPSLHLRSSSTQKKTNLAPSALLSQPTEKTSELFSRLSFIHFRINMNFFPSIFLHWRALTQHDELNDNEFCIVVFTFFFPGNDKLFIRLYEKSRKCHKQK